MKKLCTLITISIIFVTTTYIVVAQQIIIKPTIAPLSESLSPPYQFDTSFYQITKRHHFYQKFNNKRIENVHWH